MRRAINIQQDLRQIHTIEDLTEVFESIASLRIAKIRDRVIASKEFFAELWKTYQSLRVNPKQRLTRHRQNSRNVFLAITSDAKLSGGIDEQIIATMLSAYKDPSNTDIMIVGNGGNAYLRQHRIAAMRTFSQPQSDLHFSVSDVIEALNHYNQISVFYQTYESLRLQKVARIELISAVHELSEDVSTDVEVVSSRDYIFEPDIDKISDYMESVMLGVALIQVIMESKLSQYASRFNAMSRAKKRAEELTDDYRRQFYRAKRNEIDERLKEIARTVQSNERSRTN